MKKSLRALLDSPQNNLKIFKNGVVVYDHKSEADVAETILAEWFGPTRTHDENLDAFFRLVSEALFREFSTDFKAVSSKEPTPQCLENRARIDPDVAEKAKRILSHHEEVKRTLSLFRSMKNLSFPVRLLGRQNTRGFSIGSYTRNAETALSWCGHGLQDLFKALWAA